jgi:DnaJ-class molecular chaperone
MAKVIGTYHGVTLGTTASGEIARTCSRCNGSGLWGRIYNFGTALNYTCFKCNGVGLVGKSYLDLPTAIAHCAQLEKNRIKAQAKKEAKRQAGLDAWKEANKEMLEAEAKAKAERKAQRDEANAKAQWLEGSVGDKVSFSGTVRKAMSFETTYGYNNTTDVRMLIIEADGNCSVKMTTSSAWAFDLNEGDEVTMSATIKDFSEFNGGKQTVVKSPRIKKLEEIED